jgi:predicted O-methyltransferase YrrM
MSTRSSLATEGNEADAAAGAPMSGVLSTVADRVLPDWTRRWRTRRWLAREASRIQRLRDSGAPLEALLEAVMDSAAFRPQQKPREILPLLQLLRQDPPRRMLEIGGCRGGSLLLFSAVCDPRARLLSVDLAYSPAQIGIAPRLGGRDQEITCLAADSHLAETAERVRTWLSGEPLDFLFIDGDHSFEGVARDLELFAPLVRPGGTIGFHDIVPDSLTRHGISSASCSGEVPRFWRSLKGRGPAVTEFIDDPDQDGMGIGAIRLTPDWLQTLSKG